MSITSGFIDRNVIFYLSLKKEINSYLLFCEWSNLNCFRGINKSDFMWFFKRCIWRIIHLQYLFENYYSQVTQWKEDMEGLFKCSFAQSMIDIYPP